MIPDNQSVYSARRLDVFTPSDTTSLVNDPARGIILPEEGALTVDTPFSTNVTIPALAGGVIQPIQITRVYATGTDASSVILVY